jgi:hypothetical protein
MCANARRVELFFLLLNPSFSRYLSSSLAKTKIIFYPFTTNFSFVLREDEVAQKREKEKEKIIVLSMKWQIERLTAAKKRILQQLLQILASEWLP